MPGHKTRSRGACSTCKRRKRKCDETRPGCLACERRHVPCGGYELQLQWDCGVASRGHLAGSSLPVSRFGSYRNPTEADKTVPPPSKAIVITADHSPDSEYALTPQSRQISYLANPILDSDMVPAGHHNHNHNHNDRLIHDQENLLFSDFLENGINTLYATSTNDNFREEIRNAARESPALVSVCLVLQSTSKSYPTEKIHLELEKALHVFHEELAECAGSMNRGTLCAGLVLCTVLVSLLSIPRYFVGQVDSELNIARLRQIIQDLPWTKQLHCMADFYKLHTDLDFLPPVIDSFTNHCLEVMGVMDLPALVFGRTTPCLHFWSRLRRTQRRWNTEVVAGVETMSGLPRSLLDIIASTDDHEAQYNFWTWHGQMGEYLQAQLWDTWRYAGILDRRRRLGLTPEDQRRCGGSKHVEGMPSTEHLLWRLVAGLDALRLGLEQPDSAHLLIGNATFWPWLVARCEFGLLRRKPEWKITLDKLFEMLLKSYKPQHIHVAQDMIQEAWETGDETFDLHATSLLLGVELAAF
ncbi:hypothetical protein FSARC_5451 [Fusarium sarcochroum]|uniref:Zn(2)-C6 fungal-type domain-containing protein n=1 Tax=Fusarium sarcochroum TaxID=1208366 RepID=A0A8H4X9H5_9HYPO|nr:hypothetical protein FSARC_5451 [Fusarium sarcochroum]